MSQTTNYDHREKMPAEDYKRWCRKMEAAERCQERLKNCQECVEPEPCETPCGSNYSFAMGWLGLLILWFVIFTVLFWLIFYSLQPAWVLNNDGSVNVGKVLLAAVVCAILLIIVIWLIKACIDCSR